MAMTEALSNFYDETKKIVRSDSLVNILEWMSFNSQSVILNYGEDNQMWECSWIINNGRRFTSVESSPIRAAKAVITDVRTAIITDGKL